MLPDFNPPKCLVSSPEPEPRSDRDCGMANGNARNSLSDPEVRKCEMQNLFLTPYCHSMSFDGPGWCCEFYGDCPGYLIWIAFAWCLCCCGLLEWDRTRNVYIEPRFLCSNCFYNSASSSHSNSLDIIAAFYFHLSQAQDTQPILTQPCLKQSTQMLSQSPSR